MQPVRRITDEKLILRKIPTPRNCIIETHPPKDKDGKMAKGSEEESPNIRNLKSGLKNARRKEEL